MREVRNMSISTHETHWGGGTPTPIVRKAGHFYRFYSLDVGDRIVLAEDRECESDSAALALGRKLLSDKNCPKIEVWLGKMRVGVIEGRRWLHE
jgi:hypothetical protein